MEKEQFRSLQTRYYSLHAKPYKSLCKPGGGTDNEDAVHDREKEIQMIV